MVDHDVIVLGGGPGGHSAAQRLGQAGLDVLLAEPDGLGGASWNTGCVPTVSLWHGAKAYRLAGQARDQGINGHQPSFDWSTLQARKDQAVRTLASGVAATLKRFAVEVVPEAGQLVAPGVVEVGGRRRTARHVIVAPGAVPVRPPLDGVADNPHIVDPAALLRAPRPPARLAVIGGGLIGLELAGLFAALEVEVTVLETLAEVAPFMDQSLAKQLRQAMRPVRFKLNSRLRQIDQGTIHYTTADGRPESLTADLILLDLGRQPRFEGWGAERSGLDITPGGVVVDDGLRTNLPGVWAVGDVTGRSLFAHSAKRMGEVAAALITDPGLARRGELMRWDAIPYILHGLPEAAGVGWTEQDCRREGREVVTATAPLVLSSRFVIEQGLSAGGAVKVVAERDSRIIRGVHLFGPQAGELVWGLVALLELEATTTDVGQLVFPQPTLSEGIREACRAIRD
ncbi:MAG: NAD(P)/FAD-dependent oxidoreductase [Propionibacteriaceae bacterium]|jgi:dihydrolipoamide dehydrogenase|nr:NAD(P)/FAD-dependent oxidoreductase [Propionibacteriaceae bacterium]